MGDRRGCFGMHGVDKMNTEGNPQEGKLEILKEVLGGVEVNEGRKVTYSAADCFTTTKLVDFFKRSF